MTVAQHRARMLLGVVTAAVFTLPYPSSGQELSTTHHAFLPAAHNGAFTAASPSTARLFSAFDFQQAVAFEALWREPNAASSVLDEQAFATVTNEFLRQAPLVEVDVRAVAPMFFRLVPELDAMLAWGRTFRRQLRDVLAAAGMQEEERYGQMTELVASYRAQDGLAVSASPKSIDMLDAQVHSLQFRRRFPKYTGLRWAARWMEAGVYESLLTAQATDQPARLAAVAERYHQMLTAAPESAPYLLPLVPAVAPSFARQYPEAAAIVSNLHMLEEGLLDILVAREIPRSAKRQEMLRLAESFRTDTVSTLDVAQWLEGAAGLGLENMGGPAAVIPVEPAAPTVARGASMAGMMGGPAHDMSAMAGMDHAGTPQAPSDSLLMAIHQRMMSDPVIRERVATDPVLQRMLGGLPAVAGGGMAGMDHQGMPGMAAAPTSPTAAGTMLGGTPEERRLAIEFIVRLLSDPAVEGRIHTTPELHALWSDPEVQRRLAELRRTIPPIKHEHE